MSEWTGVPLATLFREVGASPKATWFLAEGSDAAVMTRSVPVAAYDDALIAHAGRTASRCGPSKGIRRDCFCLAGKETPA